MVSKALLNQKWQFLRRHCKVVKWRSCICTQSNWNSCIFSISDVTTQVFPCSCNFVHFPIRNFTWRIFNKSPSTNNCWCQIRTLFKHYLDFFIVNIKTMLNTINTSLDGIHDPWITFSVCSNRQAFVVSFFYSNMNFFFTQLWVIHEVIFSHDTASCHYLDCFGTSFNSLSDCFAHFIR